MKTILILTFGLMLPNFSQSCFGGRSEVIEEKFDNEELDYYDFSDNDVDYIRRPDPYPHNYQCKGVVIFKKIGGKEMNR